MKHEQKLKAARDPNTSPEILETLASDGNWNVRYWVARNPNTSIKILELLATDEDYIVRSWVPHHPNRTKIIERLVLMTDYKLSTAAN
jgi:hypothetical protein